MESLDYFVTRGSSNVCVKLCRLLRSCQRQQARGGEGSGNIVEMLLYCFLFYVKQVCISFTLRVCALQDVSQLYQIFADDILGSGQFGIVYGGEQSV